MRHWGHWNYRQSHWADRLVGVNGSCNEPETGKVRLCVDLRRQNVMREKRTTSILDDVLCNTNWQARQSSRNWTGFLLFPLDPGSKQLTIFITPYGPCCFRKLVLGITSASEILYGKMDQLLGGLPGVAVIMDDIIVNREKRTKHDEY